MALTPWQAVAKTRNLGESIPVFSKVLVNRAAAYFVGQVRVHATGGGPSGTGPKRITGDYNRSWHAEDITSNILTPAAIAGTNAPQARRLEFGFVDVDSLGRHYNQRPRPHQEPARIKTVAYMNAEAAKFGAYIDF